MRYNALDRYVLERYWHEGLVSFYFAGNDKEKQKVMGYGTWSDVTDGRKVWSRVGKIWERALGM